MVGLDNAAAKETRNLQILFGLVIAITPRTTKNKSELPATRIHRQCNPTAIEVAFLSVSDAILRARPTPSTAGTEPASGQGLQPEDATVKDDKSPLPSTFLLHNVWMFGRTKPTSEVTAVAQTLLCRTSWASES